MTDFKAIRTKCSDTQNTYLYVFDFEIKEPNDELNKLISDSSDTLKVLCLNGNALTDISAKSIFSVLTDNKNLKLKYLGLNHNGLYSSIKFDLLLNLLERMSHEQFPDFLDLSYNFFKNLDNDKLVKLFLALAPRKKLQYLDLCDNQFTESQIAFIKTKISEFCPHVKVNFELGTHIMQPFLAQNDEIQQRLNEAELLEQRRDTIKSYLENVMKSFAEVSLGSNESHEKITSFVNETKVTFPAVFSSEEYIPQLTMIADAACRHLIDNKNEIYCAILEPISVQDLAKSSEFKFLVNSKLIGQERANEAFLLLLEAGDIAAIYSFFDFIKDKQKFISYCNEKKSSILTNLLSKALLNRNDFKNNFIAKNIVPYMDPVYIYKNLKSIPNDFLSEIQKTTIVSLAIIKNDYDIFSQYWKLLSEEKIQEILSDDRGTQNIIRQLDNFEDMLTRYLTREVSEALWGRESFSQKVKDGLFSLYGARVNSIIKIRLISNSEVTLNSIVPLIIALPFHIEYSSVIPQESLIQVTNIFKQWIELIHEAGLLHTQLRSRDFYPRLSTSLANRGLEMYLPKLTRKEDRIKFFMQGIDDNSISMLNFVVSNLADNKIEDFFLSSCENNKNLLNTLLSQKGGPAILSRLNLSLTARSTINALLLKQHIETYERPIEYGRDAIIWALYYAQLEGDSLIHVNTEHFDDLDISLIKAEMAYASHMINRTISCNFISSSSSSPELIQEGTLSLSNNSVEEQKCDPRKKFILMSFLKKANLSILYSNIVRETSLKYPTFFQETDVVKELMSIIKENKDPEFSRILMAQLSIKDICDNLDDLSIDLFEEDVFIKAFNHLHDNNETDDLVALLIRKVPSNFLMKIIPIIIRDNLEFAYGLSWLQLSQNNKIELLESNEHESIRALPHFMPLIKKQISEDIILSAKNLYPTDHLLKLYHLSSELFDESIHNILKGEEKDTLLYYIAHLLTKVRKDGFNSALKSSLKTIINSDLFFSKLEKSDASIFNHPNFLSIMINQQPVELIEMFESNDSFLKRAFLEVLEHSSDSLTSLLKLAGTHIAQEKLIELLLSETEQQQADILPSTIIERIFSVLTNADSEGLRYLKKHFSVSEKLMAILIAELSKVLSTNIKINKLHLIRFYVDILSNMSESNAKYYIDKLYDSLPSDNAKMLISLCDSALNYPELMVLLLAKIENEKLKELIESDFISDAILNKRYFKNIIVNKADEDVLQAIIEKKRLHQWLDHSVISDVMNLSDDKKEPMLNILLSSPLRRGTAFSIIAEHFTYALEKAKNIIGNDIFIDLILRNKYHFNFIGLTFEKTRMISVLLEKLLTDTKPDHVRYKELVKYVLSYARIRCDESLKIYATSMYRKVLERQIPILSQGPETPSFNAILNELFEYIKIYNDAELLDEVVDTIMSNIANNTPEILIKIRNFCSTFGIPANKQVEKLAQFELYSQSVDALRKTYPSKVKSRKVELPLVVAQALVFDKILKYLIKKYEEVKSSEPKKPGQKSDAKWTKYQTRLNHYAKFHDALVKASMQQPVSTDLGAELGVILRNNPLPKTNILFTSDRYGQLIQLLITTPTPVLLLRFKEMAGKVESLYKGNNPPHPVKELVRALDALRMFQTDQLNQQQHVLDEENQSQESDNIIISPQVDNKLSKYGSILFMPSIEHNPNATSKERKKQEKERKLLESDIFTKEYLQSPFMPPQLPSPLSVNNQEMINRVKEQEKLYIDDQEKDDKEQSMTEGKLPTMRFEL